MLFQSLSAIYNTLPFFSDVLVSTQYDKDIDEHDFFVLFYTHVPGQAWR